MLNKKGAEALLEPIKDIILALIVLGALVGIVFLIFSPSFGIASEWSCKTSVALSSGTFGIANKLGMSMGELDLYVWYMKTGKVLK